MNPLQMAGQIKRELELVTWGDGSTVVFGDRLVHVFAGLPSEEQLPGAAPFALVLLDTGVADPDDPNLIDQSFTIIAAADVAGDPMGESALTGGAVSSLNRSANRGALELSERVRAAVGELTGIDGAKVLLQSVATGTPQLYGRGRHLVFDETTVSALCTARAHYSQPQQLTSNGSVFTWTGAHCSSRFDFVQYRLGYVGGPDPVESPDDCDVIVYTGTDLLANHAAGAGRAYSIFADYNARQSGQIEGSSDGRMVGAFVTT